MLFGLFDYCYDRNKHRATNQRQQYESWGNASRGTETVSNPTERPQRMRAAAMRYASSQTGAYHEAYVYQDFDTLNVDFEFFDPQELDFHGIKVLLQQLFDVDATLFDLSAVADLILSQPLLGSTVKVDGNETDAYAFLSVINLQQHAVS